MSEPGPTAKTESESERGGGGGGREGGREGGRAILVSVRPIPTHALLAARAHSHREREALTALGVPCWQDVTLKPGLGSKIGFNEIDTSTVGIRPER